MKQTSALLFFVGLSACLAAKLPLDFKKCKRDDPDFTNCLKDAIQDSFLKLEAGVPSLGLPSLQPIVIPSVTVGEGKGVVNLLQKYKNYTLYNVMRGKIEDFQVELTPTSLRLDLDILIAPEVLLEADYNFDGRILALPIVGEGHCTVHLVNLRKKVVITAETFDKKGVKHLKVKDLTVKLIPEKLVFYYDNLFNGNKQLGDAMNNLMNENWQALYEDAGDANTVPIQTVLKSYVNKVFEKVPYDELF